MPRLVEPKVFVLATSKINMASEEGMLSFLESIGVSDWFTDAGSDAELLAEVAGKNCYMSFDKSLNKNLTRVGTRNNHDYIQEQIVGTGHGSVLEHGSVTLAFVDVSRVFTHELVRHRAGAAYSQQSGRYVRTDVLAFYLPSCMQDPWGIEWTLREIG